MVSMVAPFLLSKPVPFFLMFPLNVHAYLASHSLVYSECSVTCKTTPLNHCHYTLTGLYGTFGF